MNIPNLLSFFRIALVPVFVALYFNKHEVALIVFAVASLTDILDGYIARKYKLITRLGTILDPVADKLMQLSVLWCLYVSDLYPLWALSILLIKEFILFIGTILLYRSGVVKPANIFGKSATVVIAICILIVLIFGSKVENYIFTLAILASCAALLALGSYIVVFWNNSKIRR